MDWMTSNNATWNSSDRENEPDSVEGSANEIDETNERT